MGSVADNIQDLETAASLMKFEAAMRGLEAVKKIAGPDLRAIMDFLNDCERATGLSPSVTVLLASMTTEATRDRDA